MVEELQPSQEYLALYTQIRDVPVSMKKVGVLPLAAQSARRIGELAQMSSFVLNSFTIAFSFTLMDSFRWEQRARLEQELTRLAHLPGGAEMAVEYRRRMSPIEPSENLLASFRLRLVEQGFSSESIELSKAAASEGERLAHNIFSQRPLFLLTPIITPLEPALSLSDVSNFQDQTTGINDVEMEQLNSLGDIFLQAFMSGL